VTNRLQFIYTNIWTAVNRQAYPFYGEECLETNQCRMRPGIVLLPRKDVMLMAVYVSVQSKYMPPCQRYLHNNAISIPSAMRFANLNTRTDVSFCTCRWRKKKKKKKKKKLKLGFI